MNTGSMLKIDSSNFFSGDVFYTSLTDVTCLLALDKSLTYAVSVSFSNSVKLVL
jgi:hypothetical protein